MRKSRISKTVLFGLALLAVQTSGVKADELATLQKGAEVRLTVTREFDGDAHTQTMKGILVKWDETTITLDQEGSVVPVTIEREHVTRVENRVGGSKRGTSALIGLGVGGAVGALLGYAGGDDEPGIMSMSAGSKAAAGAVTFGVLGALVGVLIGPGEQWEDVSADHLQLGLGSMPNGETGFIITRRF